jgi:hypothetical protein
MNESGSPAAAINAMIQDQMQRVAERLAAYCAANKESAFNPAFQHI